MSDHDTKTIESFVTLADRLDPVHEDASLPNVHVLEAIERGTQLRDAPAVILCPGCAGTVDRYDTGLPEYVAHFRAGCTHCDVVPLERWSVLAVDAGHADAFPADALARQLQRYWDRQLWTGIEPSEGIYRSEEFTRLYDDRAEAFGWDWRARCPLCRRPAADLDESRHDYHHWRHNPDIGVCLCRTCHRAIDAGHRDGDLDDRARDLGLANRYDPLVVRLAAREASVAHYETVYALATTLRERYNLPWNTAIVACIIRQAFYNENIRTAITDHRLTKGLDGDR